MGMNPETNRFELLHQLEQLEALKGKTEKAELADKLTSLVRPDGSPVPPHWPVFKMGELVEIKHYTFRVAYIGETSILFEPVGPLRIEPKETDYRSAY